MPPQIDLDAYLSRVGLSGPPAVNESGLRDLHAAQFHSIPFENFDIALGRGISLDPADLCRKLLQHRRGGYCFELNGLMLMVLTRLGFAARPLLARVHLDGSPSGRAHQLTLVNLAGRPWIIDVGFGAGGPRCPLPLEIDRVAEGPDWGLRLVEREGWGVMLQTRENDRWRDSYSFDLLHVGAADIAMGNHYTSTAVASKFVTSRIASRPLARGRVSLRNFTLTTLKAGRKTTREVPPGAAYLDELARTFGIELDADYTELRPVTDVIPE